MRLGQLSRKTGIKSEEIVEFLASQEIEVKSGSNAKVDDVHLPMIYSHFQIELDESQSSEANSETVEDVQNKPTEPLTETADAAQEIAEFHADIDIHEEFSQEEIEAFKKQAEESKIVEPVEETEPTEKRDLIKAPKLNLPGLTVVGKIDLPEPKAKEEEKPEDQVDTESAKPKSDEDPDALKVITEKDLRRERGQQRARPRRKQRPKRKPNVNPVELERRKAQKEAERQKRLKLEAEKERKRQHYEKTVQKAPIKTDKRKPEPQKPTIEQKESVEPKQSKNIIARFWRWLDAKDPTAN